MATPKIIDHNSYTDCETDKHLQHIDITANILKFPALVVCLKAKPNSADPDQTAYEEASSLITFFPVCHSDKHFVISSLDNQHFILEQNEKSVRNF